MKDKFKVGQKVKIRKWEDMEKEFGLDVFGSIRCKFGFTTSMKSLCGKTATITKFEDERVYIKFDDKTIYRYLDYSTDMIEPFNETIVIYRKDQEVIALDKTTGNKAIARCCPEDTFDFHYGAALALGRLIGATKVEEKPKYFSGLVQVIKEKPFKFQKSGYVIGKIYEAKDGILTSDTGIKTMAYESIERLSSAIGYELKEIKEVKRPAKVGEFVKIILNSGSRENEYKNGDILKIIDCNVIGDYYKNEGGKYLYSHEYVVLEGYEDSDFVKKFDDEIKVGDKVEVVDTGRCYTTYADWFDKFAPKYASRYAYGSIVEEGTYEVIAKHPHENSNERKILYAIRAGKYSAVYLIGEKGIKKVRGKENE